MILCISGERVAKDRAIRAKQEERFLRDLAKVQARIENGRLKNEVKIGEAIGRLKERYPRVARYHSLTFNAKTRQLESDPEERSKVAASSMAATCCGLTARTFRPRKVGGSTYSHTRRERVPLHEEPPVRATDFSSSRAPGESHIFLCVLAYHLLVAIETTLVRQEIHTSWATVRDLLATHEIATIVLPTDQNGVLRIRRSATPSRTTGC